MTHSNLFMIYLNYVYFHLFYSTAFKLIPQMMEFYYAYDTSIGDRLMFLAKDKHLKHWESNRIAA